MEFVNGAKRVVIKIGSSLLVDQKTSSIRSAWLHSLSEDIRDMHSNGIEVVIVSSGSIALGRKVLSLPDSSLSLEQSQASAAVVKFSSRRPIRSHWRNTLLKRLRYSSHLKIAKIGGAI